MKVVQAAAFAVGAVTFGVLLWTMDAATVGRLVLQVGWGMALIIGQEIVAHLLNALAWRFAFTADQAGAFPLRELVKLRVTGDAINYLTPSATIAGEVTRAQMLNGSRGAEVRTVSVLVAKCTQTLAQILFVAIGLVFVAAGHVPAAGPSRTMVWGFAVALALLLATLGLHEMAVRRRPEPDDRRPPNGLRALGRSLRRYLRTHPGRFSLSALLFLLGYAWGAFEAYWICRFLGLAVSIGTAAAIEVLSTAIDGVLFAVPAKAGTQEGGKTAIFALLGLPVTSGLAFGVVRHIRELVWAGVGLALYAVHVRTARRPEPPDLLAVAR